MLQHSERDSAAHEYLAAMFEAVKPYADAATSTQREAPAYVSIVLETGDALTLDVVHTAEDGHVRRFRGIVAGPEGEAVACALAALVTAGLNRMSVERRQPVARVLEAGETITVVLDPLVYSAAARLTVADIDLFVLRQIGHVH